jgi:hypothetical protein
MIKFSLPFNLTLILQVVSPLRRDARSAVCTQWFESRRIHNHTLLSHLRLSQPGGLVAPYLYLPGIGWPSYTPGQRIPFLYPLTTRRGVFQLAVIIAFHIQLRGGPNRHSSLPYCCVLFILATVRLALYDLGVDHLATAAY